MKLTLKALPCLVVGFFGLISCETLNEPYYGSPSQYSSGSSLHGIIVHGEQYYVKGGVYYKRSGNSYYRVANPYSSAVRPPH